MQKIFHNILMTVDVGKKTNEAVSTAIDFANHLECHLHLLFIDKRSFFSFATLKQLESDKKRRIKELKERCQKEMHVGLKLFITRMGQDTKNTIAAYIENNEIDMVLADEEFNQLVFAKKGSKQSFGVSCPVFTIRPRHSMQQFKTIVLPISSCLPINKIRVSIYLAMHFDAAIHLVALEKKNLINDGIAYLKRAFQLVKENTELSITCATLSGKNLFNAASQYASGVNAGLIVMNPGDEMQAPGFVNRLFSKIISKETGVPVITVA